MYTPLHASRACEELGTGAVLGGRCRGANPPPPSEIAYRFLMQLVFMSGHQSVTPFLSGAPPPKTKSWIRP